jgi:hypothetical protein
MGMADGRTPPATQKEGIIEQTRYGWWKSSEGLKLDQAKRLEDGDEERGRLMRLVEELSQAKAGRSGTG